MTLGVFNQMNPFLKKEHLDVPDHATGTESPEKNLYIRRLAHDMNGDFFMVTSACLMLRLAIEKKEDPLPLLDHLNDACQKHKNKLGNFLEYTRIGAGMTETYLEAVEIRQLLLRVVNEFGYMAEEKEIDIDIFVAEDVPDLMITDETRLFQIVTNLLINAIAFSPKSSHVMVNAGMQEDRLVLMIKDHGEGMTDSQLDSLFKHTLAEKSELRNPAGLGLLVTRYLVEVVLEGTISVASRPQEGTLVEIKLPLKETVKAHS